MSVVLLDIFNGYFLTVFRDFDRIQRYLYKTENQQRFPPSHSRIIWSQIFLGETLRKAVIRRKFLILEIKYLGN